MMENYLKYGFFNPLNKNDIYSGVFRDANKAVESIQRFDDRYNIYFTFNELKNALDGLTSV